MKSRLIFFAFFLSFPSYDEVGPLLRPRDAPEIINLNKISLYKEVYIKSYPEIDPQWLERFAIPFSIELGNFLRFDNLPVNFNFLGFYKIPLIFQGGDYVLRAQIAFPLLD